MLNRRTIIAIGLGSLMSLATMAPAVADRDRGGRHDSGNRPQASAPYSQTHQQLNYSGRNHRPALKERRHAYRRDHGYRGDHRYRGDHGYRGNHGHRGDHRYRGGHSHSRYYPRGRDHRFADGLVFGGILGYLIGNDY